MSRSIQWSQASQAKPGDADPNLLALHDTDSSVSTAVPARGPAETITRFRNGAEARSFLNAFAATTHRTINLRDPGDPADAPHEAGARALVPDQDGRHTSRRTAAERTSSSATTP